MILSNNSIKIYINKNSVIKKYELEIDNKISYIVQEVEKIFFYNTKNTWVVSTVLTDDNHMKIMNIKYKNAPKPTNVLSFKQIITVQKTPQLVKIYPLGDVILSMDTIKKESLIQDKTIINHICHLFLHGLLHLLGFTHKYKREKAYMENFEILILKKLKINNPYVINSKN
jgi:probable rRNA maturation factor